MNPLRTYWIRFEKLSLPGFWNLGCGVTAFDRDDAIGLVRQRLISIDGVVPRIMDIAEDVKTSDLEQRHVLPNIGDMNVRGIWFPKGLDSPMSF